MLPVLVNYILFGDLVILVYSDYSAFPIYKCDFDKLFGPIMSTSKDLIENEFSLLNKCVFGTLNFMH